MEEYAVDVTIGIAEMGRQLTLVVEESQEQVEKRVSEALSGTVLTLVDEKGRTVIVPTAKIAFVEIGAADSRKVGFVSAG